MPTQSSLGVEPMCRLAQVSRAGFYRFLQQRHAGEEDMEVRDAIQQIALEHRRRYGYRRVTVELHCRGMAVNHKRVLRLMREDNLLAVEPKALVITTQSDHGTEVYLNLASRMKPTAINQLWVADITYIRLRDEFVYLALVLDVFSRRVVGWEPGRTLTARLPMLALERERLNSNLGSLQYQAMNPSMAFIAPSRTLRNERIEHRDLRLLQFRDSGCRRETERID
jgi:putative transposase